MDWEEIIKKMKVIFDNEKSNYTVKYEKIDGLKGRVIGVPEPLIVENVNDYELKCRNMKLLLKLYSRISKDTEVTWQFLLFLYETFNEYSEYRKQCYLSFHTLLRLNKIDEAINALFVAFINLEQGSYLNNCFGELSDSLKYEHYLYTPTTLDLLTTNILIAINKAKAVILVEHLSPSKVFEEMNYLKENLHRIKRQLDEIQYKRLEKELEEGNVIEINQDKVKLQQLLKQYNFSKDLQESLDRFEKEYMKASDEFDFKNCIGHVRCFIENLGKQIITKIQQNLSKKFIGDINKAMEVRDYLRDEGFITKNEHDFYRSIYGLSSNDGVHKLKANKETARLCKNIAIEFSLMLLQRIDNPK